MKKFKPIDHPSDVGIIAYGADMRELFENAALGMFCLMADLSKVKAKVEVEVKVEAEDKETLLVNWLNELIFLEDSKRVIFKEFKISEMTEKLLNAKAYGEKIDPARHAVSRPVKAATYNQLEIKKEKDSWRARIVFDV